MFVLTCPIRDYAWGSRTHLARFLGVSLSEGPQAELWIGAHRGDPAHLPDGQRLDDFIRAHPTQALGERVHTLFGARLPFLLKALAAAEPLSLQVHPTSELARNGYASETAAGVPRFSPTRNYQDDSHKPELVFALTRFEGMAGFREVEKSAQILRSLHLPWADEVARQLESGPASQTLRAVVTDMLARSGPELAELLGELGAASVRAEARGHLEEIRAAGRPRDRFGVSREGTRVFAQTAALTKRYPRDPGVLVTLLLNHVVLAAGEAMFLDAGVIHSYTSGFGVEVMASSDNVVRAGLTPKHVDVPELLSITNFTPIPPPLWEPAAAGQDAVVFEPPVSEFRLAIGQLPVGELPTDGPRVVLVLEGSVQAVTATESRQLTRGEAMFVTHEDGELSLTGDGRVAVVSVPG